MPIAIDVGSRALHLVEGQGSRQDVRIKRAIIEPLPPGLVQDGLIRDPSGLEMAIKGLLSKYRIHGRKCILTINGTHVINRELDLPPARPRDLDRIVAFEVQASIGNNREVVVEYTYTQPTSDRFSRGPQNQARKARGKGTSKARQSQASPSASSTAGSSAGTAGYSAGSPAIGPAGSPSASPAINPAASPAANQVAGPDKPEARSDDQAPKLHIRASALQTDCVSAYHKLLRVCKLKPIALDIHPNSLAKLLRRRAVNDRPLRDGYNVMFLDIGAVTSTVYVYNSGEIVLSRIFPVGGSEIERTIANINEGKPPDQVFDIKNVDLTPGQFSNDDLLARPVRGLVASLSDGIQRIQQFLSGRSQGGRVELIYIYGRTATIKGLAELLTDTVNVPVELVKAISHIHIPSKAPLAPFMNAIGALIRLKT